MENLKFSPLGHEDSVEHITSVPMRDGTFTLIIYADKGINRWVNTVTWHPVGHSGDETPEEIYAACWEPRKPGTSPEYPNPGDARAAAFALAEKLTRENAPLFIGAKTCAPHVYWELGICGQPCLVKPGELLQMLEIENADDPQAIITLLHEEGFISEWGGIDDPQDPIMHSKNPWASFLVNMEFERGKRPVFELCDQIGSQWAAIFKAVLRFNAPEDALRMAEAMFSLAEPDNMMNDSDKIATTAEEVKALCGQHNGSELAWSRSTNSGKNIQVHFGGSDYAAAIRMDVRSSLYNNYNPKWGLMKDIILFHQQMEAYGNKPDGLASVMAHIEECTGRERAPGPGAQAGACVSKVFGELNLLNKDHTERLPAGSVDVYDCKASTFKKAEAFFPKAEFKVMRYTHYKEKQLIVTPKRA